ncbi:MAG: hypothetical protein JWP97_6541 [Labilithrix sp.]|nr:hypothetical protein [Labilithrix sp.]
MSADAWRFAASVAAALVGTWLALVAALLIVRPKGMSVVEALRVLPDTLRLLERLARDRTLPRGVRIRLVLLLGYLALPFDLIPDFLPLIGQLDDVIVALLVLRSVVAAAGPGPVRAHWPGTDAGLVALWKIAGLRGAPPPPADAETLTG